ncbi:glycosyltransferase family 4 protein [Aquimarina agarivorans]|uniref:glycosyltransferase family 4 protein n=1 Tax=Aquimarina agarivorans TaxID=980584 RepID=UPI000248EB32|nr:glycosyltransferase [Aquimarina agarivorans]
MHTFEYVCSHYAGFDYRKQIKCTDCSGKVYKFKIFKRSCSRLGLVHSYAKGFTALLYSYFVKNNLVDRYIVPSNFLKKKMLNHPKINFIEVLYNPLKNSINKVETEIIKRKTKKEFCFVYFGRLSEEKNIECIIKAFNASLDKYPFFKLMIIGKGVLESKLKKMVVNLGLEKKVFFKGFLERSELTEELNKCHVSVLSSKCYETASMVVLESVQQNLLPIVCDHGGMKEMVNAIGFGLKFDDNNFVQLSNKMGEAFVNYDKLLNSLSSKKKEIILEYTDLAYYRRLKKIYNNCIESNRMLK